MTLTKDEIHVAIATIKGMKNFLIQNPDANHEAIMQNYDQAILAYDCLLFGSEN